MPVGSGTTTAQCWQSASSTLFTPLLQNLVLVTCLARLEVVRTVAQRERLERVNPASPRTPVTWM